MTDLAVRSTVRELVRTFQETESVIRDTFARLVETQARLNLVFTLGNERAIRIQASRYSNNDDFEQPDEAIKRVARQAWSVIVERLELKRMMSIARYAELERQLEREDLPEITEANVEAFARQYVESLPTMLQEAVTEVFEWLRPHHSRYKTNSELEVPRRVILTSMVERRYASGGYRVNYYQTQRLTALENCLNSLDGSGQISKTYQSALQTAIEAGDDRTPLFTFRAHRNGNLHLTFRRLDLLKKFNAIAGGKNLKPGA